MTKNDVVFIGSMPEFYDRHLKALFFQPYADDLAHRLSNLTAGKLLETAAGTGIVTEPCQGGSHQGGRTPPDHLGIIQIGNDAD
jgi:hypothetical protein